MRACKHKESREAPHSFSQALNWLFKRDSSALFRSPTKH
jgi:hypothetical protein